MKFSAIELNSLAKVVEKERARRQYRSLVDFSRRAWGIIEGGAEYRHNWHIDIITTHLEMVFHGEIPNLLMNVPPGAMKSILTSVMFPAWGWTLLPETRFLSASYGQDLSTRDAMKSRVIIESEWYQELWGNSVKIDRGQNQKTKYQNTLGGWRLATSVGGRGTGEHPDYKIIDDPHNVREADSDTERATGINWYDLTMSSRGVARDAADIVVMQRLHELDLSGHIMTKPEFATDWEHICLPMRYEPNRYTSTVGEDPREKSGEELLWPDLFSERKVKTLETNLGEYGAAGQLQQRPAPPGGGILKTKHFQLWPNSRALPGFELIIQSYDTAFKEPTANDKKKTDPDPSACSTWGIAEIPSSGGKKCVVLLDVWAETLSYPKLKKRVLKDWGAFYGGNEDSNRKGKRADVMLIEDKASGQSLIQDLHAANIPVFSYNPGKAGKTERAHLISPLFELDVIYILESSKRPNEVISWAKPFISQVEKFPNGENDDMVDTFTQMMLYVKNHQLIEMPIYEDDEEDDQVEDSKDENPYS